MKMIVQKLFAGSMLLLFGFSASAVNIPNTFTANAPASASEVNANFSALSVAVDANTSDIGVVANSLNSVITDLTSAYRFTAIYYTSYNYSFTFGSSTSEVASATCPTGSILVGGGVECRTDLANWSTTNFGVVNATLPVGNTILGGCTAEALTYSALKWGPPVTVRAICLSPAIIPVQAKGSIVAGKSAGQGEPSEEALLAIEKMKEELLLRQMSIE